MKQLTGEQIFTLMSNLDPGLVAEAAPPSFRVGTAPVRPQRESRWAAFWNSGWTAAVLSVVVSLGVLVAVVMAGRLGADRPPVGGPPAGTTEPDTPNDPASETQRELSTDTIQNGEPTYPEAAEKPFTITASYAAINAHPTGIIAIAFRATEPGVLLEPNADIRIHKISGPEHPESFEYLTSADAIMVNPPSPDDYATYSRAVTVTTPAYMLPGTYRVYVLNWDGECIDWDDFVIEEVDPNLNMTTVSVNIPGQEPVYVAGGLPYCHYYENGEPISWVADIIPLEEYIQSRPVTTVTMPQASLPSVRYFIREGWVYEMSVSVYSEDLRTPFIHQDHLNGPLPPLSDLTSGTYYVVLYLKGHITEYTDETYEYADLRCIFRLTVTDEPAGETD